MVDNKNTVYDSRENCNAIIGKEDNRLKAGCKTTVIPESVIGIEKYAFNGCSGLKSIAIPKSVKMIRYCAFSECSRVKDVYYSENLLEWNKIDIDYDGNDPLKSATIHFAKGDSLCLITKAKVQE